MSDIVLAERRDALLILTMNRPHVRNALDHALTVELTEAMVEASRDDSVRAVVLTGADGAFCVGGDVKAMNNGNGRDLTAEEYAAGLRPRMEVSAHLHGMGKPTVAAIEGPAAGAGLAMALACDFRIASTSAKLTTAFAKVGLSGDFGGTYFMTKLLGSAKARELYLLSPVLSGTEAHAIGLVTRTAEPGTVLDTAIEFASKLASGPTLTYARIKENIARAEAGGTLVECLDLEARNMGLTSRSADHREAAAAFVEKRPPVFAGA